VNLFNLFVFFFFLLFRQLTGVFFQSGGDAESGQYPRLKRVPGDKNQK
jgi:hypothetical protein